MKARDFLREELDAIDLACLVALALIGPAYGFAIALGFAS